MAGNALYMASWPAVSLSSSSMTDRAGVTVTPDMSPDFLDGIALRRQ